MSTISKTYYTIGSFAKLTSTTEGTLRFYERRGLLKPSGYNEKGHRIYSDDELFRLHQILNLKYFDYSLDEISKYLEQDSKDFHASLEMQHELLLQKQQHIQRVVATIERVREVVKDNDTLDPELLMLMIRSVQHEEEQRQWLSGRLPDTLVQSIFMSGASREERTQLEREVTIGLNDLLILFKQGLPPEHHLVQERALALMQIMEQWFGELLQGLGSSEAGSALEETNWQLYPGSFPPNIEVLLVARFFQAAGLALLLPLMMNAILILFPAEKRGAAMGLMGLVLTLAPASGPTVAGLIIEKLSWHWIFWISGTVLFISLIFGIIFLKNISVITRPKIDILSLLLSTIGFGSLLFGFSKAGESGWSSMLVISFIIIGVVALILFTWRQLRIESPIMNLRTFRFPMFSLSVVLFIVVMMLLLSSMLLLPMLLQNGLGKNTLQAGLLLLPGTLISGIMGPLMGKMFDKYGPRRLIIPGLILIGAVMFLFSTITVNTSTVLIVALHCTFLLALSMVMMPAKTNGMNQLPAELYPHGTAIMSTLQQVAGAIGSALAMTMLATGQLNYLRDQGFDMSNGLNLAQLDPAMLAHLPSSFVFGIKGAFIFAGVMSIIALFISFFMKRVKPNAQEAGLNQPESGTVVH